MKTKFINLWMRASVMTAGLRCWELLSCLGQPQELVNFFLAPMKSVSISQRIKEGLDCLRQRYNVSGGLTIEPKIIEIHWGAKIAFNESSLKQFNEKLNTP